jgi:molybdate transport system substrate-binding protein
MNVDRRSIIRAIPALPLAFVARAANAVTTDLVLNCDTALGPVMTTAAARFFRRANVRVRVFPTGPGLVLPQLAREIQNDLICTQKTVGEAAVRANSDATPASDMDGPAIIQALALGQSAVLGVIDTDEVLFLLHAGQAEAGLLHMTDVQANPELQVLRVVPDDVAPALIYAIAVTKGARRPNPQAFVDFLMTPEGAELLQAQGLEAVA